MMDFSGFSADEVQEDNVAGLRRMWKVLDKSFASEYPAKADIVAGEITVSPTVRMTPYLVPAEYVVPQNTAMYSDVLAGARGYQAYRHVVGYQMAGLGRELLAELLKDINAGSVYFLEDTNGNINVAGSSKKGLPINTTGSSGKDGNEQRGKVMAAEEVGFRWPVMPLSSAARTAFFRRFLGYSEVRSVVGVQPATLTVNISFTIIVADYKAFQIGDRVNVRGYFGSDWSAATFGPFAGTITNIVANGVNFNVVILGDAANGGTVYTNSRWKILRITENGNL